MKNSNDDFDMIKELAGAEEAHGLAEVLSGSTIYIPKSVITAEVHKTIRKEYKAGADYKVGIVGSSVYRHRTDGSG